MSSLPPILAFLLGLTAFKLKGLHVALGVAAPMTIAISNISWSAAFEELGGAWKQLWQPILLICLVMAVANVMNFGGMSSALALAVAGLTFPLLSPIIGWIGVFVTQLAGCC